MTGLVPMLRKELLELTRTHRLTVVLVLYVLVGLGSPLLANLVPMILALVPEEQLGGVELLITQDPTATDALVQYLKNMTLMPVVVVLVSMGAVAAERQRETLPMLLARPLSRRALLLSKLAVGACLHTLGVVLAAGGCALYTVVLFGPLYWPGYLLLNGLLLLGLLSFLALTMLGSVLFRSQGAAAGLGLAGVVAVLILGALPAVARYTPAGVWTASSELVTGRAPILLGVSVGVTLCSTLLCVVLADRVFARQEI